MFIKYPGIAQLVARVVWDHQVGGSSPSTRTITPLKSMISEGSSLSCAGHGNLVYYAQEEKRFQEGLYGS